MSSSSLTNSRRMGREFVKAANSLLSPPAKVQSPLEAGKEYRRSGAIKDNPMVPASAHPYDYSPEEALLLKEWSERPTWKELSDPVFYNKWNEVLDRGDAYRDRMSDHSFDAWVDASNHRHEDWVGPPDWLQEIDVRVALEREWNKRNAPWRHNPPPKPIDGSPLGPGKMPFGLRLQHLLQSAKSTGSSALSSAKDWASDNPLYAGAAGAAGVGGLAALAYLAAKKKKSKREDKSNLLELLAGM